MNDKLLNKVITISAKEEKSGQYGGICKLKDEKGLTYNVYEKKKDGTTSVAWEQLRGLKIGSTVQIGYGEETKDYQGKAYIARTIRSFNEDIGNGVRNTIEQGNSRPGASQSVTESPGRLSQEEFSRRLGVQGHVNALLSNPTLYPDMDYEAVIREAIRIEDEINKQLNPSKLRQAVQRHAPQVTTEDLPVIEQGEDVPPPDDSDIPF